MCLRSGSRGQISNRIEDGRVEFVRPFSPQSPVEDFAHISASPPKLDVILIVCHRVLGGCESELNIVECGHTRIIIRRNLAAPKAA